eukprot:NODE_9746_length_628_cov_15.764356_g9478_i0.p2 GENE.NODE_9746_length_628_cov_15.764356_g9478_i0~~NODE_9746_length_628_cov_15.764356_g9478_i0.p2  ORF type:complete len:100 (-),score=16.42 NODE_9746_length_628_cov_15.764356_g9478_i0:20-319(-)
MAARLLMSVYWSVLVGIFAVTPEKHVLALQTLQTQGGIGNVSAYQLLMTSSLTLALFFSRQAWGMVIKHQEYILFKFAVTTTVPKRDFPHHIQQSSTIT